MLEIANNRIVIPETAVLISKTDLQGVITYASSEFCQIAGFESEEALIGQPHNVIRHPETPEQIFDDLWATVKKGEGWNAVVKNRHTDGYEYWVEINTSPIYEEGAHIGYVSVCMPATDKQIEETQALYKEIHEGKMKLRSGMPISTVLDALSFFSTAAWLRKYSISGKFLLATLPLLAISMILSGSLIYKEFQSKQTLENMIVYNGLVSVYSRWVHESQKERGMTAGYIGSGGKKFKDRLPKQRELFNQRMKEFELYVYEHNLTSAKVVGDSVNDVLKKIDSLQSKRNAVDSLSIPLGDALKYYTGLNKMMLSSVAAIGTQAEDPSMANRIFAYESFLESKERAGIERAVLTNTFARDNFAPGLYERFLRLVAEQNIYNDQFYKHAEQDILDKYNNMLSKPSFSVVQGYRDLAVEKHLTGGFETEPGLWSK